MNTITCTEIYRRSDVLTEAAQNWCLENIVYLNKPMTLFGKSIKVDKGKDKRDTYILYLQPAGKVSAETLCSGAQAAGCEGPCLISSGMLGLTSGQRAATKRTVLMLLRPQWFHEQVLREIDKAERRAVKTGIPALFRLNGTSDIDWSTLISERPNSGFYDYTKILARVRRNALANYHLTFSGSMFSKQSRAALGKAIKRGNNVAVAFNVIASDKDMLVPYALQDFDKTDLRPLDPTGSIGALTRKGSNKKERSREGSESFFVTEHNIVDFNQILWSNMK